MRPTVSPSPRHAPDNGCRHAPDEAPRLTEARTPSAPTRLLARANLRTHTRGRRSRRRIATHLPHGRIRP